MPSQYFSAVGKHWIPFGRSRSTPICDRIHPADLFLGLVFFLLFAGGVDAAAAVGATVPFTEYEAEAGTLNGGATVISLTTPPTTEYSSPELEASGHAFVQLNDTGQSVSWKNATRTSFSAVDIRFSIPDAPGGGGMTATLDLFIDGVFKQAINLSSGQTWLYENAQTYNQNDESPADGHPRLFFDEARILLDGAVLNPGSVLTLRKGPKNTAAFYDIDVIDLEAPSPMAQPDNSLSITTFGAAANDKGVDSTVAIQKCFDAAAARGRPVWIPPGTFYLNTTANLSAKGITIQGAGLWFSTIYRNIPVPNKTPLGAILALTSCTVKDISLDANAKTRASSDGDGGGIDMAGSDWLIDGVCVEHTSSGLWAAGDNGTVQNCRMLSTWGDGINLNNVSNNTTTGTNLTARNNFIRGTGDDALAINSVDYNDYGGKIIRYTPMSNITLVNNTSVAPWGGKGLAIYGGSNQVVKDNLMCDTARYVGLGVGKFGVNGSDLLSATVTGNMVLRCGGNGYRQKNPALFIGNGGDGQNVGTVDNAYIASNTVVNAMFNAVGFTTSFNTVLLNNTITSPGLNGIFVGPGAIGNAVVGSNNVTGLNPDQQAQVNNAPQFHILTPILATDAQSSRGFRLESCAEGGRDAFAARGGAGGTYLSYNNVDFSDITDFEARVASYDSDGTIEIHLDSPNGPVIGTCNFPKTGGPQSWINASCRISGANGTHDVYVVCSGGVGVQWMAWPYGLKVTNATDFNTKQGVEKEGCSEGGEDIGHIDSGDYVSYDNVDLTDATVFLARTASASAEEGRIEVHLDTVDGHVIGRCRISGTGDWQKWATQSCSIDSTSGKHAIFLVFVNGGFNLHWFAFHNGKLAN